MTKIIIVGGGCAAALAAIARLPYVVELIETAQEAEQEAVRSRILTARGHGFVAGQEVQIGREIYRVRGTSGSFEMDLESMVRAPIPEPKRSKPAYGTDRPYLKKKKGRS